MPRRLSRFLIIGIVGILLVAAAVWWIAPKAVSRFAKQAMAEEANETAESAGTDKGGVRLPEIPLDLLGVGRLDFHWDDLPTLSFSPIGWSDGETLEVLSRIHKPAGWLSLRGEVEDQRLSLVNGYIESNEGGLVSRWVAGWLDLDLIPEVGDLSGGLRWRMPGTPHSRLKVDALASDILLQGSRLPQVRASVETRLVREIDRIFGRVAIEGNGREELAAHFALETGGVRRTAGWGGFGPTRLSDAFFSMESNSVPGGMSFAGTVSGLASVQGAEDGLKSTALLRIRDGEVGSDSEPGLIRGIESWTALNLVPSISTSEPQTIRFEKVVLDRFESGSGRLQWRLSPDRNLTVSGFEWNALGGIFSLEEPVVVDFSEEGSMAAAFSAEGIDLEELIHLIQVEEVDAEGRLSGRLAVTIRSGKVVRFQIRLGLGTEEAASLRFGDLTFVREMLGQGSSGGSESSDILVRAVSDLRLSSFDLDIDALKDGKNTFLRIQGGSRAPDIEAPNISLDFNMAIPYRKILRLALAGRGLSFSSSR